MRANSQSSGRINCWSDVLAGGRASRFGVEVLAGSFGHGLFTVGCHGWAGMPPARRDIAGVLPRGASARLDNRAFDTAISK